MLCIVQANQVESVEIGDDLGRPPGVLPERHVRDPSPGGGGGLAGRVQQMRLAGARAPPEVEADHATPFGKAAHGLNRLRVAPRDQVFEGRPAAPVDAESELGRRAAARRAIPHRPKGGTHPRCASRECARRARR